MLETFLIVIFFICVAFVFNEGLWGACVLFVNVLLAAVLATNVFERVANWFDSMFSSLTFFNDFLALWACFAVFLVIFRIITDMLSRHRVRFKKMVDLPGGVFFAAWIGWIMVQFTLFSLHVSPMSRNFMGFQEKPETRMFMSLAPDRNWLAFMQKLSSEGALARSPPAGNPNAYVFDPQGDFILKYGARRKQFEAQPTLRVKQ